MDYEDSENIYPGAPWKKSFQEKDAFLSSYSNSSESTHFLGHFDRDSLQSSSNTHLNVYLPLYCKKKIACNF